MASQAIRPGVLETLQLAQTVGNGQAYAVPANVRKHIFYVDFSAGVGAGAVSIETANDPEYTGTWAPLVNDLATPTVNPVTFAVSSQKIYTYIGVLAAIRARISTTVTGGTVTVTYKGEVS